MSGVRHDRSFPKHALILFVTTSMFVLTLEILERADLIAPFTESSLRLMLVSVLMGTVVVLARRARQPTAAMWAISACAFFVVVHFVVQLCEDISYLETVPLIGNQSQWKHAIEKAVVAGWTCSVFAMLFVLMESVENSHDQIQQREQEQRLANERLQSALSDLKAAEQRLVQRERLAALGQLASGIAHDLNNALAPVVVCSHLLEESTPREEDVEAIELISKGARHAARIVAQLQEFYLPSSQQHCEYEPVDLAEIASEALMLTRPRWHDRALRDGVNFDCQFDKSDDCVTTGNATELKQVVMNLLLNAFDAMPSGGRVILRTRSLMDQVVLQVIDHGIGMTAEQRSRCFEPFFTSKTEGGGLGLSVCHGIVTRHAGQIEVARSDDSGTSVEIRLPKAPLQSCHVPPVDGLSAEAHQQRILYIDDDDAVRRSIQRWLEKKGYDVDLASTGDSGIQMMADEAYDLVITDLGMKGVSGWNVVQQAKRIRPEMPVGVVSGWSSAEVTSRFRDGYGPDFVIEKPLDIDHLADAIAVQSRRESS